MERAREPAPLSQKVIATALTVVAMAMLIYQLVFTQVLLQSPEGHKITHYGFALVVLFLSLMLRSKRSRLVYVLLLLTSIAVTGYFMYFLHDIVRFRTASPLPADIAVGVVAVVLAFIGSYLIFGKTFPIVAAISLLYLYFGRYLPFPFQVAPVSLDTLLWWLTMLGTDEGIYGDILGLSASYLFLFIFFGSLLHAMGGLRFIMSVAQWVGARLRSGPAAVSVIGSSLVGTVTGSTVANITITGAFTIPMMKKAGYKPEEAGAIEAAASNGGQIMPPIMGAAAFVMAGYAGIPYAQIALAAVMPAVLYYIGVFLYVELTARKLNIKVDKVPVSGRQLLLDAPIFLVPLGVLVFLLFKAYSLPFVGFWAMITTIAMGLVSSIRKEARLNLRETIKHLTDGVRGAAEIAVMAALIGVVATAIKVSGLGVMLPLIIQDVSGGNLVIALVIGMVASIILGMGVPTVVAYILVAIGLVPALVQMGVPLLAAHFFPFFYAVYSNLTPPVAIGALVASRLAGARYWPTCGEALKMGFTGLFLPFAMIYAPALYLRPDVAPILAAVQIGAFLIILLMLQMGLSSYLFGFGVLGKYEGFSFILAAFLCIVFIFTQGYLYLLAGVALAIVHITLRFALRRRPAYRSI
ncbi:MAG: TRAP transporter fused permease subunit [Chloroflexi bacterium]|nr:TRAP transporter fused permease subunit [Chloroflexota bacterium]